jgi:hypothetical protein
VAKAERYCHQARILKTNKIMQQDKTWILIPMLLYTKYSNGNIEFCFGWLRKVLSIKFSIKFKNK